MRGALEVIDISMQPVAPREIRYIKLGPGNAWAKAALERGELSFGYSNVPHEPCLAGDWEAVVGILRTQGRTRQKARDQMRAVHAFYTLGADCLWITFALGHLWWAFAEPEVIWFGTDGSDHGARRRRVVGTWCNTDIAGSPLTFDGLSSRLTQVAGYRQTICSVEESAYLVRRINAAEEPVIARATAARSAMIESAAEMIAGLHWADFETMVDLIFARSGWQRVSRVGGTQKDVDLVLRLPTTGEGACVQVKSKAGQRVLDDYINRFEDSGLYDRMFFVCHTPKANLVTNDSPRVHVWTGKTLAIAATDAGLFDWLMVRSS